MRGEYWSGEQETAVEPDDPACSTARQFSTRTGRNQEVFRPGSSGSGGAMRVNIGILGCGCVGSGVLKILKSKAETIRNRTGVEINVRRILYRSRRPAQELVPPGAALTQAYGDLLDDGEIDILVELIGGLSPAHEIVSAALGNGTSVVTANKAILAGYLPEYRRIAAESGANLEFEGAVAGSIPIMAAIKSSFVADDFSSAYGILNGTANYVLTRMSEGMPFSDALALAQKRGFAEADPAFDVSGRDAAQKLAILAMLIFNTGISGDLHAEGITDITADDLAYARDLGCTVKLIAKASLAGGRLGAGVYPALLPFSSALAHINNENNAVYLRSDNSGDALLFGKGAGELPTASAVISDVVRIALRLKSQSAKPPVSIFKQIPLIDPLELSSRFYIRYSVLDKVGILARIAGVLGNHNVSIAGVWQKNTVAGVVSLVMTTHSARVRDMFDSVRIIDSSNDLVRGKSLVLRIDDLEG